MGPENPSLGNRLGSVTVRDVARAAGFSLATVSLALRHSPRVKRSTAERVRETAARIGYRPDPMVATLMARLRGRRAAARGSAIALLAGGTDLDQYLGHTFFADIVAGVQQRAEQLGFRTELFPVLDGRFRPARVREILYHRGIEAVIVLPMAVEQGRLDMDWSALATVAIGYSLQHPAIDRVCPDQFQGMQLCLERLRARGYRRPGLCLDGFTERRVFGKWLASFERHNRIVGKSDPVPALVAENIVRRHFVDWLGRHRPDVVIAPDARELGWVREINASSPQPVGYCVACWMRGMEGVAGIDQQPRLIGAAAADSVVGLVHRNQRGIPAVPTVLEVPARWIDGVSLPPVGRGSTGGRRGPVRG